MSTEDYADTFSFLKLHTDVAELIDPEGEGRVLVAPGLAGRVMTSTTSGVKGAGLGWVNRPAFIAPLDPHFTNYGGEERLWLGPEGGQFSLYFAPEADFTLESWYVPGTFNEEPFDVISGNELEITLCKTMALSNRHGTAFSVAVERTVRLISRGQIGPLLGISLPKKVTVAAYETENILTNRSAEPLCKETGLISIWLLGMLAASPKTAVLVPYRTDDEGGTGAVVRDDYFGTIPADRLVVTDTCVVFKGDAQYRSKIGFSPARCKDRLGSLDLAGNTLTVVTFTFAGDTDYVNSAWELQEEPYRGDVVNSYNDGPAPGAEKGLGDFYELESSSPARELAPGESLEHTQKTFHFHGTKAALDTLARRLLGAGAREAGRVLG